MDNFFAVSNRRSFIYSASSIAGFILLDSCSKKTEPDLSPTPIRGATSIATWGDSLTEGVGGTPYPTQLGSLFSDGRTIYNGGHAGNTSTQSVFRLGLIQSIIIINVNDTAHTGPIPVIPTNVNILPKNANSTGILNDIPGTLSRDNDNGYTFTRTDSNVTKTIATLANFTCTAEKKIADFDIHILWLGQNDIRSPDGNAVVLDNLAKVINAVTSEGKTFITLSVIAPNAGNKGTGGDYGYNSLISLNNSIKAISPDNFIDIRAILISSYKKDSSQDVIDFNNDIVPTSLRFDSVHLNTSGYGIVAQTIMQFIKNKNK